MMARIGIRRALGVLTLTGVWCALWGEVSAANVSSGAVISALVMVSPLGPSATGGIRIVPLARFVGLVVVDLVVSTVGVAWEILTPTDRTDEVLVAVPVPTETRAHLLLLIVAVTVTPGTAVVDADPDTGTLYLHLLHADREAATTAHVGRLAALACQALPIRPPAAAEART